MNTKKVVTFIIAVLLLVLGFLYYNCFSRKEVSIATGGKAGTYFVIGGAMADAVNKDGNLKVSVEKGHGAVANITLVADNNIELGFTQADIAYWAYNGKRMFENAPIKNVRAVCALYPESIQLIVNKKANINKLEDLKGKRVGVGLHGSGTASDFIALLRQVGMTMEEIKTDFLDFSAITTHFAHDRLDAGFVVAGTPTKSIAHLFAITPDATLLNFDDEFLSRLQEKYPFIVPSVIPAGAYAGLLETKTPSVMSLLVVRDDADDKMVYNFLEGLYANIDVVHKAHVVSKNITLENATLGLTIPLHPAAEKFFREKGIIK